MLPYQEVYEQKTDVINEKFKFNYCISYSTRKTLTCSSGGCSRKPVKERLRTLWFFSLEKAKRAGGSPAVWKCFTRGYKEDRDRFFLDVDMDRKESTCRSQTKRNSDQ